MRLLGKRAIVTGGASGIGAAIARRFAAEGAAVTIADLDLDGAERLRRDIVAAHPSAHIAALGVDVADPEQVTAMIAHSADLIGDADVLVNNAGVNVFREPLACDAADWRTCMDVDLDGAWHCCRAVLPAMLARGGGAIVNMASNHALRAMPDTFPYGIAKHGLIGLTRALAVQYAEVGVRVNAISPGFINTPINDRYFATFPDPVAARMEAAAGLPVGRLGEPEEVALVAVLLASDEALFICGANIVIDGGVSARM